MDLLGIHLALRMEESLREMAKDGMPNGNFRLTRVIDETQPPNVMATFRWSDEKQVFVGPKNGPQRAWKVILKNGNEKSENKFNN